MFEFPPPPPSTEKWLVSASLSKKKTRFPFTTRGRSRYAALKTVISEPDAPHNTPPCARQTPSSASQNGTFSNATVTLSSGTSLKTSGCPVDFLSSSSTSGSGFPTTLIEAVTGAPIARSRRMLRSMSCTACSRRSFVSPDDLSTRSFSTGSAGAPSLTSSPPASSEVCRSSARSCSISSWMRFSTALSCGTARMRIARADRVIGPPGLPLLYGFDRGGSEQTQCSVLSAQYSVEETLESPDY